MATIEKRNGAYRIRAASGYDQNGKQIRQSMTWKPEPGMTKRQIEKELERQAVLFDEKVQNGTFISSDMKLADFFTIWFERYAKEQLSKVTYKNYMDCTKRIIPALGHIPLRKLQPQHLIAFYAQLSKDGIRGDIKYKAAQNIKALMKERSTTQTAIYEKTGIAVGTIRSAANGNNVTAATAAALAAFFDMPVQKLFVPVSGAGKLSGTTALYYHRVLSSVLTTAVYWQIIPYNPCARVKPPRAERKEAKYLDAEQAAALLDALQGEPMVYRALFTMLLYTGMRRGEACGLEWSDIDFENGLADINKSSTYLAGVGVFDKDTKTASSHRVIKMPLPAVEILQEYRQYQRKERLKIGDRWKDGDKVFTSWDGSPLHPDTVSGWFHDFVRRHGLPEITVHGLRHTNATLMIASGSDIKTVSKRLGHANVTTTGNIYTHALRIADEMAADALGDMLAPKKSKRA